MANKEKTRIRLQKVHQRLCKVKYPTCPHSRAIVKANERIELTSKYTDFLWSEIYRKGFIPNVNHADPIFQDDFAKIATNSKLIERLNRSIDRYCQKLGTTEDEVMKFHSINNRRLSTSF